MKQIIHPCGEEEEEKKKKKNYKEVQLYPYSILHWSSNNNYDNTTLITFKGVNTSAEWIKKGK